MSYQAPANATTVPVPEMVAIYTPSPVCVDGELDDPIWKVAPAYAMAPAPSGPEGRDVLAEPGLVRLAWDTRFLYLAASFTDSDVVAEGESDGMHHYQLGDVCELFLKPEDASWYWEFYVTPAGRQSCFFFPSGGRRLPSCLTKESPLTVAARVHGTLNNWRDRDLGWTAEMAVPLELLTAHGNTFVPGSRWRILVGRYNYSRYLSELELSSYPPLPRANFHDLSAYANLQLTK